MTVRVYRSTDAGAPSLIGTRGSLINVLSAVLTGPSFNGTGNAYGSTPCAGWSRPFTGTNLAAYQQPATANQRFLLIDETTADSSARVTGYETMTSISGGVGPFPAGDQITNSKLFLCKSTTFDATSRPWIIIATDKLFHMWVNCSGAAPPVVSTPAAMLTFGDFISYAPGDTYNTVLISAATVGPNVFQPVLSTGGLQTLAAGHFYPRSYNQTGTSAQGTKGTVGPQCGTASSGGGGLSTPNATDGKIYVSPFQLGESVSGTGTILRGELPGVYALLHTASSLFNDADMLTDVAGLPGKTLELHYLYNSGAAGAILLETSNTW